MKWKMAAIGALAGLFIGLVTVTGAFVATPNMPGRFESLVLVACLGFGCAQFAAIGLAIGWIIDLLARRSRVRVERAAEGSLQSHQGDE